MSPISSVFSRRGWRSWQHFASVANDRHDGFAAAQRSDRQQFLDKSATKLSTNSQYVLPDPPRLERRHHVGEAATRAQSSFSYGSADSEGHQTSAGRAANDLCPARRECIRLAERTITVDLDV